jgi:hypothetical protein
MGKTHRRGCRSTSPCRQQSTSLSNEMHKPCRHVLACPGRHNPIGLVGQQRAQTSHRHAAVLVYLLTAQPAAMNGPLVSLTAPMGTTTMPSLVGISNFKCYNSIPQSHTVPLSAAMLVCTVCTCLLLRSSEHLSFIGTLASTSA